VVGVGQQRHVRERVVLVQSSDPVGVGPVEIDAARGRERPRARRDQVLHRLPGPAFIGREGCSFGRAHERALCVNVGVPNLFIAQCAVEAWALDTVGLIGLAGVAPDLLWRMDVVDAAQQLGMQCLNVVGLAVAIGDRLPVGVDLDGEGGVAAEVAQIAPGDVVGHRLEVIP
jgi:hypothetical protein